MSLQVAIVADDLTGALDSAAPFAALGSRTVAALDPESLEEALSRGAEVIAVNTLSRHLEPATAAAIAERVATRFIAADARLLFKKIDSRMRGNVGAEVSAVARALDADAIVMAPAVPAQGRIVTSETIRGAGVPAEGIDIRTGMAAAAAFRIEIPDSPNEDELDKVAASCLASAGRCVAVGAHGFAAALARQMGGTGTAGSGLVLEPPVLVVVGSQDPATAEQVAALAGERGLATVTVAIGGLLPPPPEALTARVTVIRSVPGVGGPGDEAERFADGAGGWCSALRPRTLLATGGDTAATLLCQLGYRVLEVGGEAAPGIPWSRMADGAIVLTKSGGFGRKAALLDLFRLRPSE